MKITPAQMNHPHLTTSQSQKTQPLTDVAQKQMRPQEGEALTGHLKEVQQELSALPEVDGQKIARLKAAIQEGKISIDADKLAAAMQKYYRR